MQDSTCIWATGTFHSGMPLKSKYPVTIFQYILLNRICHGTTWVLYIHCWNSIISISISLWYKSCKYSKKSKLWYSNHLSISIIQITKYRFWTSTSCAAKGSNESSMLLLQEMLLTVQSCLLRNFLYIFLNNPITHATTCVHTLAI